MLHSIASLTNAALAIVGEIWTAARDRTVPWNAHLILDHHVCDVTEVQQNRPQEEPPYGEGECQVCHKTAWLVDGVCYPCWRSEMSEEDLARRRELIGEDDWWGVMVTPAGRDEEYAENFSRADLPDPRLKELDEDPRFADPFARPDWNGDPNEY